MTKSNSSSRLTAWFRRNDQRILWTLFLISFGYVAAGWKGLIAEALLVGTLISLSILRPIDRISEWRESGEADREWTAASKDHRRTTYVRIQKPKPLLMGLRIGGQMRGMGWKDVTAERYDTHPEGALEQAVEDYDGYRISHYCEQHPDAEIDEPLEQIDERAWIKVNPERDLPDE